MKFLFNGSEMVLATAIEEPKPLFQEFLGGLKGGADWATDHVVGGFFELVWEGATVIWDFLITFLPDIMGYGTMLAGALMILGAMTGKGGMMKVLAIYAGFMIFGLCILGGA
ncbi:hypothetical protein [Lentibacillus sp. Marseille-P4043]|uniref:hypothetical protein n=1 Tax=Lentibacillus sp. Marseille-P4043 TaxID=2040293 RepID=UPI000D0B67AC|nr:hypothetical protein [Lentibacillus sp. Marseille-P4043]